MPRTPDQSRSLFDGWAASYDADLSRSADGPLTGYQESLRQAARLATALDGEERRPALHHILDIGVGTGAFAALLEGPGVQITGIDPSLPMLARCREKHPGFELRQGSFLEIPFGSGSFDLVISSFALHEVEPHLRAEACAGMARVLRPGGWLCLLDIIFASTAARAEAAEALGRLWDPDEDYPLVGDLDSHLRTAGFTGTRWRQTAACHWVVVARNTEPPAGSPRTGG